MGRHWGEVWAATLLACAMVGCSVEPPRGEPPEIVAEHEQAEDSEPQEGISAQWQGGPPLSCEEIRPEGLGPSTSFITRANAPEADCGPGTGNGAGYLALLNSGPFGAVAWEVVSRRGVETGGLAGGDFGYFLLPQPRGFHVVTTPLSGAFLTVYSAEGRALRSIAVAGRDEPLAVAADPRGGTLVARWVLGEGDTQVLTLQFYDSSGEPQASPVVVRTVPRGESPAVAAGVDVRGRVLGLWREPGEAAWVGQWLERNGSALTEPFAVGLLPPEAPLLLRPLSGGGLALRIGEAWELQFPSGVPEGWPAPAWLAENPGSDLVLIRRGRAYALVPPPTFIAGSGCQESLLLFARDGTACGELTLPFGGSTCAGRRVGIALEGTVIQQIELNIPANNQCAWRWWPKLLR
jgi:hypothetical protein